MKSTQVTGSAQWENPAAMVLEDVIRAGAHRMLQTAVEMEVAEYIQRLSGITDGAGHRKVVRNGWKREREIQTGIGPIKVRQPRVEDRRPGEGFTSRILPPYMRRVPSLDALIPALYLNGVSTGDFGEALSAILGPQAQGLSATNIVRLKEGWTKEYEEWQKRDLSTKHYVYVWADGVYFNVRLEDDRTCILVLIGATAEGDKELLAVYDGYRESKASWQEVLRDLKRRGLKRAPLLATGDGALGFWSAMEEEWPTTRAQRCWVHKTANVLDKMPKGVQGRAKSAIHDMYMAETKKEALGALKTFLETYKAKYPKACECLLDSQDALFAFYDFPAEHWTHLRTSNPIESTFATVRHRTRRTKGCGSRIATLTMVFKLASKAEHHWRKLNNHGLIFKLLQGSIFVDGVLKAA
jgi:transposase-like protein